MVKVYIKESGNRKKPKEGFGYIVGTDVIGYSHLLYRTRARFLDGHFILEETHDRGSDPKYHQFKIMSKSKSIDKSIDKILYPKAKKEAGEFLKELIPELEDRTSTGKSIEEKISQTNKK